MEELKHLLIVYLLIEQVLEDMVAEDVLLLIKEIHQILIILED